MIGIRQHEEMLQVRIFTFYGLHLASSLLQHCCAPWEPVAPTMTTVSVIQIGCLMPVNLAIANFM